MGVTVITGHRLEALFDALCARLEAAPPDPMATETILVPGLGIARWLELRLAERLGISAGIEMPFLGAWLHRLTEPRPVDSDPFSKDVLTWRIWRLLEGVGAEADAPRRFGAASDYIRDDEDGRKRMQLCRRISACIDDYQLYRDDLLEAFSRGDEAPHLSPHASWQSRLWRALLRDAADTTTDGAAPSPHRLATLRARLDDEAWCAANLPRRLQVFGTTTMPPAFLRLLHRLGACVDVTLFAPQPTPHFIGDLREKGVRAGDHWLLGRFGTESRELQSMLIDLEESSSEDVPVSLHTLDDVEGDGAPPTTLLACLQHDLVQAYDRSPSGDDRYAVAPDDNSLRVHDCHSQQRELEVVRDQICAALAADKSLRPHDIMVLVPDVESYAPLAHAVFGPLQDRLPFHIADRHPARELPACRATLQVLNLTRTRLTVTEVLQILEIPAVQRRFRLFGGEVSVLRHLCQTAGVRWGLDGAQRSALFQLPDFDDNSWRQGIDRLVLGNLTGPADDLVCGVAPVGDTTEARAELLTRFTRYLQTLFDLMESMRAPQPLSAWADRLDEIITSLFEPTDPAEEEAVRQLRRAAVALRSQAAAASHTGDVHLHVFSSWLDSALAHGTSASAGGRGFLGGAITFAGMLPMRAVPVRALFVCGLDDASFPRRDSPSPFDLIAAAPRPGDRSRRLDDRQLFLDLLLAARDRLHLTFIGRSAKDNAECTPSIAVSELLEHIHRTCVGAHGSAADQVLVRHPLQPWSTRYRGGDPKLFTYAPQPPIGGADADEAPWCPPRVPIVNEADEASPRVSLADLLTFWRAPCRVFLERTMRVRVRGLDEPEDTCEPFALGGLDRYALQDDAVSRAQRGDPERVDSLAWSRARGVLPVGAQGDVAYAAAMDDAAPLLEAAAQLATTATRRVDVTIGDAQITGELDGLAEDARTTMRASGLKTKDQLRAWIEHLVMTLQAAQAPDSTPPWPTRTRILSRGAAHVLRPVTPDDAESILGRLLQLYREGLTRPLAFFEHSSHAIAEGLRAGKPSAAALTLGRRLYEIQRGEHSYDADLKDASVALCMRGRDPISEGEDGECYQLASELWTPLLDHLEEAQR
ncbi:MAG: exodeoxyribonuclease V subunit gamma [Planctomycetota bacterium]|nr:exodeoxyribonuclease V subunit gamma [Planctomycetota bacterium]